MPILWGLSWFNRKNVRFRRIKERKMECLEALLVPIKYLENEFRKNKDKFKYTFGEFSLKNRTILYNYKVEFSSTESLT